MVLPDFSHLPDSLHAESAFSCVSRWPAILNYDLKVRSFRDQDASGFDRSDQDLDQLVFVGATDQRSFVGASDQLSFVGDAPVAQGCIVVPEWGS